MNKVKNNRNLISTIVLLALLNVTALFLLWYGNPSRQAQINNEKNIKQSNERIKNLLGNELGFDEEQINQFLKVRHDHKKRTSEIQDIIRQIKKQMLNVILQDNPPAVLSDSLVKLSLENMGKLDKLTFEHFLKIRKICKPEQLDKLKILLNDFYRKGPEMGMDSGPPPHGSGEKGIHPPPPQGERPNGPPPRGERPPKRN